MKLIVRTTFITILLIGLTHSKAFQQCWTCGTTGTGTISTAFGYSSNAPSIGSMAFGYNAQATNFYSTAIGLYSTASGGQSVAIGQYATATADQSYAFGKYITSAATGAITIGCSSNGHVLINPNTNNFMVGFSEVPSMIVNEHSFMTGFANQKPTFYVGPKSSTDPTINVGIGTNAPTNKLHVVNGNILISRQSGQTKKFGSLNGSILFGEFVTEDFPNGEWGIEYYNPGTVLNTGGLNFWKVASANSGGSNYNLFLRNDGNVGIGTSTPQSTLAVNGKVTAKEFEATLSGFHDYVFNDNYNLRSLKDLENYIQVNKHLPEIPSEKEVLDKGLNLGEMNALLVKKIEELTLYIISMQKEIEELKTEHTTK
jgi:hypothetical protein